MPKQRLQFKSHLLRISDNALSEEARLLGMPSALLALIVYLRFHSSDVAAHLGVSRPTLSNWASGRYPIPAIHHQRLVALLSAAIKAAEMISTHATPDTVHAIPAYKNRVARAQKILKEIDSAQG